jgi:hypothetical protein
MRIMRRTLQKCLQNFFHKNRLSGRKTQFSQKYNLISAKFPKALLFSQFSQTFPLPSDFR